jgi:hypothetical protein
MTAAAPGGFPACNSNGKTRFSTATHCLSLRGGQLLKVVKASKRWLDFGYVKLVDQRGGEMFTDSALVAATLPVRTVFCPAPRLRHLL